MGPLGVRWGSLTWLVFRRPMIACWAWLLSSSLFRSSSNAAAPWVWIRGSAPIGQRTTPFDVSSPTPPSLEPPTLRVQWPELRHGHICGLDVLHGQVAKRVSIAQERTRYAMLGIGWQSTRDLGIWMGDLDPGGDEWNARGWPEIAGCARRRPTTVPLIVPQLTDAGLSRPGQWASRRDTLGYVLAQLLLP